MHAKKTIDNFRCVCYTGYMDKLRVDKTKLKAAMHAANISSQQALADAANVSRPTIIRLVSGDFVTTKLDRIADALGVHPVSLLASGDGDAPDTGAAGGSPLASPSS